MSKLTIFAGHYGSGKTNIAVNYALYLRKRHDRVLLCDLDIVNPYFRTADAAEVIKAADITLIASPFANSNMELHNLPGNVNALFDTPDALSVMDVGGDDRGMAALGRYASRIRKVDHELLLVANCYRPLANTVDGALRLMREMEIMAKLKFTGIVNNPNLGAGTTVENIRAGDEYIRKLSEQTGLPVVMTTVRRELSEAFPEALALDLIENRFLK